MYHCTVCNQNTGVNSCTHNRHIRFVDGEVLPTLPYTREYPNWPTRCNYCGVLVGGVHHPGCDLEVCPRCKGQLIACDCEKHEPQLWGVH